MTESSISCDKASLFFESTAGQYLLEWEQSQLDQVLTNIFGYYAIQIGLPQVNFLRKNRILNKRILAPTQPADILAIAETLPIETASMDLVVLPHQLEFSDNPHQILREAERILMPEGKLIITGFNPMSLWGLYRKFATRKEHRNDFPFTGQFIALNRLKDWLSLLNLEVTGGAFGCYRPPSLSPNAAQRFYFLEKAGNRWWPTAGAAYLIVATKKVYGMKIIPHPWLSKNTKKESDRTAPILPAQRKKL